MVRVDIHLLPELLERFCQRGLTFGLRTRRTTRLADLVGELRDRHTCGFCLLRERAGPFDGALDPLLGHHLPFFGAARTGTPGARSNALSLALPCLIPARLSAALSLA